jgi:hypothetical protein
VMYSIFDSIAAKLKSGREPGSSDASDIVAETVSADV